MKTLDARDVPCPKPLILTKQTISTLAMNESVLILLNDEIAHANIIDFLKDNSLVFTKNGLNISVTKTSEVLVQSKTSRGTDTVIAVVDKNYMGHGDKDLGGLLLKAFLGSLTSATPKPSRVYFYNGGVLLLTDIAYKTILDDLRTKNITLHFCGACIKYFEMEDKVEIKEVTNMQNIIDAMGNANSIIRV